MVSLIKKVEFKISKEIYFPLIGEFLLFIKTMEKIKRFIKRFKQYIKKHQKINIQYGNKDPIKSFNRYI